MKGKGVHEKSPDKSHTSSGGTAWRTVGDGSLVTLPILALPGILTDGTFWKEDQNCVMLWLFQPLSVNWSLFKGRNRGNEGAQVYNRLLWWQLGA